MIKISNVPLAKYQSLTDLAWLDPVAFEEGSDYIIYK